MVDSPAAGGGAPFEGAMMSTIEDHTVAQLRQIRARMEARLTAAIQSEMAYFRDRYGFTPRDVWVDFVDATAEYVVSGVRVKLPVDL